VEEKEIKRLVKLSIIEKIAKNMGIKAIPVAISARHVHISNEDMQILFGRGYQLSKFKSLSQPGQYAAKEKVDIVTTDAEIKGVRVLGPARDVTQVELSASDCRSLGLKAILKMSGDVQGSESARLVGPNGSVELSKGVIVAKCHIHASKVQAENLGINNKERLKVEKQGARGIVFSDVVVRIDENFDLEMHIDTDEANAGLIKNGDLLIVREQL
jgi:putative phosphotransacetylase